jgi:hypothetical protein
MMSQWILFFTEIFRTLLAGYCISKMNQTINVYRKTFHSLRVDINYIYYLAPRIRTCAK